LKSVPICTFSSAFGDAAIRLAKKDQNVLLITAAMTTGTGLKKFRELYSERLYDVGIAEEHALVFAAGLAAGGCRPVVAMYATFLQRALDCVMHDVCLQKLPVVICADRAGIVEDGPTHHGIHDLSFLRALPNLNILMPSNEHELHSMLFAAHAKAEPVVIRYAKTYTGIDYSDKCDIEEIPWGKAQVIREGDDLSIWALGAEVKRAEKIADDLFKNYHIAAEVVNVRFVKPFDKELLIERAKNKVIVSLEDHHLEGGMASLIDELLIRQENSGVLHFGWKDEFIGHGGASHLRKEHKLDRKSIVEEIVKFLK